MISSIMLKKLRLKGKKMVFLIKIKTCKQKFALKSWFKWNKAENYQLKKNIRNLKLYIKMDKNYKIWCHWSWRIQISLK